MEYQEWLYPLLFFIILGGGFWIISWLESKVEDTTHHDNRPGSYHFESSKALKEKRDESYGNN